MSKKATTLKEIYGNFAQERYLTPETKAFYVNLYERDLKRFVTALRDNEIPSKSFYIAGQRGNGKSSVLHLLTTEFPILEERYIFHYLAGREIFIYEEIDIVDVLLMIGYQLTQNTPKLKERYLTELKKLEDIKSGALVLEEKQTQDESGGFGVKAKLSVGTSFFSFLKAGGDFDSTYKINEAIRQDARRFFKLNKNKLIDLINQLILDYKMEEGSGRELLIVVDDLEKKDEIDQLFTKDLRLLDELNLVKIITMPIHLHYTQTFADKDIREFALKLEDRQGNPCPQDKALLKEVIYKRVKNRELINDEAIENAVIYSGGNLRQLIRFVHFAAEEALAFEERFIGKKEMQESIARHIRQMSPKVMLKRRFLKMIKEREPLNTQEDLDNLAQASKMQLIFAYYNGEMWYDLNPIAESSL
jgi:hypothetical protein